MAEEEKEEIVKEEESMTFAEFLESVPPSRRTSISDLTDVVESSGIVTHYPLIKPEIQLHCPSDNCNGTRFFRCETQRKIFISTDNFEYCYITYVCSNCRKTKKTFSLAIKSGGGRKPSGECYKFGENPVYGPPTPARLVKLIGPDRELFLKGRRCENQGLGVGAFVYYRRVVENQKNRILSEVIKVSEKLCLAPELITKLEEAKGETQFSKAMKSVKDAMPQTLLINGHNPLTLLHTALSDGLHDQTDDHCLMLAHSIRVVLGDLSERLAQALKDEVELTTALSNLMKVKR